MDKSRVSIVKCENYDPYLVQKTLRRAVDLIGGMGAFVRPGERVLVKPNILSARKPEEAVCTHPEIIRAVIRLLKEKGASVTMGDSPGGFIKDIRKVYDVSGISDVAREENVNLVKFTFTRAIDGFPMSARALEADKIISIPKFKTHETTGITAAIKNMYGTVVGLFKTQCHAKAPTEKDLAKIIAKVFSLIKPTLSILDAVWSMEGEGPSAGEPRKTNFLMASSDAVAIDSLLAILIGCKPLDFAVTRECKKRHLGETDIEGIDILGDNFSDFLITNFKLAKKRKIVRYLPVALTNFIASFLRFWPEIDNKICKKCNLCKLSCPMHAISVEKGSYEVDRHKCVRCMCCHEVCPYKAIHIRKSWLAQKIWE